MGSDYEESDSQTEPMKKLAIALAFKDSLMEGTKLCVIDPPTLFDFLPLQDRTTLSSRGFNVQQFSSADREFSFAIFSQDLVLRKIHPKLLQFKPYRHWEIRAEVPRWYNSSDPSAKRLSTHHFYVFGKHVIHVVAFMERDSYFWHAGLPTAAQSRVNDQEVIFGKHNGSYERFEMANAPGDWNGFYVPDNIQRFLLQIKSSRHLECSRNVDDVDGEHDVDGDSIATEDSPDHPPMFLFNRTTLSVIREMKNVLGLRKFWLASGTLLGWRRECGLIRYTHDVDFAAWATDLDDHLVKQFNGSSDIKLLASLGQPLEDLELWLRFQWLRVDLFFVYEDKTRKTFWVGGHRPEKAYSFKYTFPSFRLCSAGFLGEMVHVPCDPDDVIATEYGPDWRTPKSEWNYELSARNVLGRRYWGSREIKKFPEA